MRKAKYSFLATAVKGRDQLGPSHPRMGLKTPPPTPTPSLDPVSNATSQATWKRHAQARSPPQKYVQPVASGDAGRWAVPRNALAPLGRSPPPRLESGTSTGTPWHLWGDPHFSPELHPSSMRVVPMMGLGFQPPSPCPKHKLGTLGRRGSARKSPLLQ